MKADSGDRIERNVDSYLAGQRSGVPEGMARALADLIHGRTLAEVLAECRRTTPRVDEELRLRGVAPIGAGLQVSTSATETLIDAAVVERLRLRNVEPAPVRPTVADVDESAANEAASEPAPSREETRAGIAAVTLGSQPPPRRTELVGGREAGAVFSGGRSYRYLVWRIWGDEKAQGLLAFVKHNPSKAGADRGDPTFDRAVGFAKRQGFAGVVMANVAAIVATDPGQLRDMTCKHLAGAANGRALRLVLRHARTVVVGWGNPATPNMHVLARRFVALAQEYGRELYCLGTNDGNHPRHLLARGRSRIPDDAKLERWIP